ncbi:MAG TPA: FAD-dependent oxidoreductase [Solirubrobacteraceae bacterium]|nr:FAD-dependent oxidoreductase [Solirubrobacteraceae bacterium]
MAASGPSPDPHRVVIAGGGFAALEAVLALRALAGSAVRISLVSPDRVFAYRPAATLVAFSDSSPREFDLAAIAAELGVRHYRTRVESVAGARRQVLLASGGRLTYDTVVLATGVRGTLGVPGALTFRDHRDLPRFRDVLRELDGDRLDSLVFAVPSGVAWPLPLYELAMLSAARARHQARQTQITLVSPEPRPLAAFGAEASELVAAELSARGVRFLGLSTPGRLCGGGALSIQSGAPIKADRLVAVPRLRGASIAGVPANRWGFVATDAVGQVEGIDGVYAAGDVTAYPIKHGGLATQQADRIAHTIAAGLGLTPHELKVRPTLEVRLIGGERPLHLRIELDEFAQPTAATLAPTRSDRQASWTKVFGRYLTPYLETQPPSIVSR